VDLSKEGSLASKDGEPEEGDKKDDKKDAVKVSVFCLIVNTCCFILGFKYFQFFPIASS